MIIWIDDVRPCPYSMNTDYAVVRSVNEAKEKIEKYEKLDLTISYLDMDSDAGDYANDGGDYWHLLDWLEETGRNYPIRIHSMNPVARERMRAIIQHNNWKEIF